MNVIAILGLIAKAVSVIETAIAVGKEAAPAIEVIKDLVTGAQTGMVTDEQLARTEALLDSMMANFNTPI